MKKFIAYTLLALFCAGAGIGVYCSWDAIVGTINKSKYYTSADVQNAYNKGYDDGITNETELTAKNEYLQSLVDKYYIDVQDLNGQVKTLTNSNTQLVASLDKVTGERDSALNNIDLLNNQVASNNQTIAENEQTISTLQSRIATLQASGEDKSNEIATLRNQVNSLQTTNQNLQTANDSNLNTITILNNQIATLNSSITTLTEQIQNNSNVANGLNNKITQLEQTIAYYEQYIQQLENENQVVATFEFNGSVYNVQIVAKNSKVSVVNPSSTDYVIFNGWKVNNENVDLNNYTLTANTKFVADVTYKHKVVFMSDNSTLDTKFVVSNTNVIADIVPSKEGYEFDGWTINGVDLIDLTSYAITQDTTLIAKFTQLHTLTFIYEGTNISTQVVRNGNYANIVNVENTAYKSFNGWLVNGTKVDLSTYKIVGAVTFIADITYSYDVIFRNGNDFVSDQIVMSGNYANVPTTPIKQGYIFLGWATDEVGTAIVDISSYAITENIEFWAIFKVASLSELSWNEISDISASGHANEYFKVGDYKTVRLTNNESLTLIVLGFNHDELSDGTGKAGITFGMKGLFDTMYKLNTTADYSCGWKSSSFRISTLSDIISMFPSDLQNVVKTVNKKSTAGNMSSQIVTTQDTFFLFSISELLSKDNIRSYVNSKGYSFDPAIYFNEGTQYEYYANNIRNYDAFEKCSILMKHKSSSSSNINWFLRSSHLGSNNTILRVNANGQIGTYDANYNLGISLGFCI